RGAGEAGLERRQRVVHADAAAAAFGEVAAVVERVAVVGDDVVAQVVPAPGALGGGGDRAVLVLHGVGQRGAAGGEHQRVGGGEVHRQQRGALGVGVAAGDVERAGVAGGGDHGDALHRGLQEHRVEGIGVGLAVVDLGAAPAHGERVHQVL